MFIKGTYESDHFTPYSHMNEKILVLEESSKLSDDDHNMNHIDCDPNKDDENNGKSRKRTGKGHQSKNLEAERKRRKKLNDRLYTLRALVPNISKLDRTAILGDTINYIKELEKQVKNMQIELEQDSNGIDEINNEAKIVPGINCDPKIGDEDFLNGIHKFRMNQKVEKTKEKEQQMEAQVEVFKVDGNELFVKVLCEYKAGGLVRLIEAITSLGLNVINVNTTRNTCLVSNIFRVERKDSRIIQAHHVKESLLKLPQS